MKKSNNTQYWASLPAEELADAILDKVEDYYRHLSITGRMDLYRRSWTYYYRPRLIGSKIGSAGEQNELSTLSVNHYRNLLLHLETMTTQARATFDPRATNSDVKSQSQVILATGLLEYYMREKKLERYVVQAVKDSLIFGEGFVRAEWDATSGEEYGKTSTGAPIYNGDMKYTNFTPLNVIRDFSKESGNDDDWHILKDYQNKFTLAAKFPELADQILSESTDVLEFAKNSTLDSFSMENSDNVAVYTLIHKPTPALPNGRYVTCLDNGTIMMEGPIPYKQTHVYRIAPDEESGTIFGYTVGYDILPIQQAIDILYSTVITNQSTFGVQNILVPKGHDLSTSQMAGGLNVMEYDPKIGRPEPFNLTSTPPEIFNFIQQLEHLAETISGVNSVARGNPEASLKSGAALALVQSMALQFSMGLQRSYAQLVEDLGTGTINILQAFASTPRVAAIAGKSQRPLMRDFTGGDLDSISRVMVDMGNPLTRTTAGKVNLAETLLQNGMIENPDQYIQVMSTGKLDPIIEGKQAQLLLIRSENEQLAQGIRQRALKTDPHAKHILEHTVVLSNPEIRQDPNSLIVDVTLAHIEEHIAMMNNPAIQQLSAILHQEAAPPAPPPAPAPQAAAMLNPQNPLLQQAEQVNMPNAPQPPSGTDPNSAAIIEEQGTLIPQ